MNVAIVVAGGKGTRFGSDRPKQFLELKNIPVIVHTLLQFERCREIGGVVVVLPREEVHGFETLVKEYALRKVVRVLGGGETRAQSVKCGLDSIEEAEIIAVHDGVRPLVTPNEIDRVIRAAQEHGAAILVAQVEDTIKQVVSETVGRGSTLPRSSLRRALTPQAFQFDLLKRAYVPLKDIEASQVDVTDDSMLIERLGIRVPVVEGSARNIKITTKEDLAIADALLDLG